MWEVRSGKVSGFKELRNEKVVVGRHSQCIYRMIQGFLAHGIGPWFFIVHGICPWFLTHSYFSVVGPF